MITEHAVLDVKPGQSVAFEIAMRKAVPLISASEGFQGIEVLPCIEKPGRYLLLVKWNDVDAHEIGFRESDRYQEWKRLLHEFYNPFPVVQHYRESIVA
jgi:heme-degrading monooxygenase HmoA